MEYRPGHPIIQTPPAERLTSLDDLREWCSKHHPTFARLGVDQTDAELWIGPEGDEVCIFAMSKDDLLGACLDALNIPWEEE